MAVHEKQGYVTQHDIGYVVKCSCGSHLAANDKEAALKKLEGHIKRAEKKAASAPAKSTVRRATPPQKKATPRKAAPKKPAAKAKAVAKKTVKKAVAKAAPKPKAPAGFALPEDGTWYVIVQQRKWNGAHDELLDMPRLNIVAPYASKEDAVRALHHHYASNPDPFSRGAVKAVAQVCYRDGKKWAPPIALVRMDETKDTPVWTMLFNKKTVVFKGDQEPVEKKAVVIRRKSDHG